MERLRGRVNAAVRQQLPEVPYLGYVQARVLVDHGDQTVDLEPLDADWPLLTRVPYEVPFCGARCKVRPGAVVLLGFEGGNATRRHALAFRSGDLEFFEVKAGPCTLSMDAVAGRIVIQAPRIELNGYIEMMRGGGRLSVDDAGNIVIQGTTVAINS